MSHAQPQIRHEDETLFSAARHTHIILAIIRQFT